MAFSKRRRTTDTARASTTSTPSFSATGALSYRALEPRVVFDGAGAAVIAEAVKPADKTVDTTANAHTANPAQSAVDQNHDALVSSLQGAAAAMSKPGAMTGSVQIVFVENNLAGTATLLGNVPKDAEVVLLDSAKDGVDQIAQYLGGRSGIGAIHILSHGTVGEVDLGTAKLTTGSLATTYAADIGIIKAALAPNADILLYGCDIAQGSAGHAFVQALATATGNNVAASTDVTGSARYGGNWVLEDHVGDIETAAIDARNWDHELAPLTISVVNDPIQTGGTNAGAVGLWTNAGTIGSEAIDIRATVVSADAGVTINFATRTGFYDAAQTLKADDMWVQISGGDATVKWEIFKSGTNQTVKAVGDPNFRITDIDGYGGPVPAAPTIEVEAVAPDLHGLTTYVVGSPTNLNVTIINGEVLVRGTQNQNSEPTSLVGFNWTQVSSWQVTYSAAPGYGTRFFYHDGNGDFQFVSPQTTYMLQLDADADNSTAAGTSSTTTYTENGSAVRVVDTDVLIAQQAVLGTSLQTATVEVFR